MFECNYKVRDPKNPCKMMTDTAENILNDIARYTLDPVFEKYGDFVNHNPSWLDKESAEKYKGCTVIFGNFLYYSHAFNIITDDENIIKAFEDAVKKNKSTSEYIAAKNKQK